MVALDHGAIEAHYKVGKNSDVVLTPDLRILVSGPGQADVRIRLNDQATPAWRIAATMRRTLR